MLGCQRSQVEGSSPMAEVATFAIEYVGFLEFAGRPVAKIVASSTRRLISARPKPELCSSSIVASPLYPVFDANFPDVGRLDVDPDQSGQVTLAGEAFDPATASGKCRVNDRCRIR